MQFVNIVVHSVEDMNFRVHLQYEFTSLGLDTYLERLRSCESEELQVQISAYLDNVFDVAALMDDSETKSSYMEKVAELEDELGQVNIFHIVIYYYYFHIVIYIFIFVLLYIIIFVLLYIIICVYLHFFQ